MASNDTSPKPRNFGQRFIDRVTGKDDMGRSKRAAAAEPPREAPKERSLLVTPGQGMQNLINRRHQQIEEATKKCGGEVKGKKYAEGGKVKPRGYGLARYK